MSARTFAPGATIDGFQLEEALGRGAMGEVWRGVEQSSGRPVVLKTLAPEFTGDPTAAARFRAEARHLVVLDHPNLARVISVAPDYLALDFVPGRTLESEIHRLRVLPPERVTGVLAQVGRALEHVHDLGIVHRDVKPANVIVDGTRAVLTDFGIALSPGLTRLTQVGRVMGTAAYLAPEVVLGRAYSSASDVYALGVAAHYALTGEHPFTGAGDMAIAHAHVDQPVPPLPSDVGAELAALTIAMLTKEPGSRPSARSVAERAEAITNPPAAIRADILTTRRGATAPPPPPRPAKEEQW